MKALVKESEAVSYKYMTYPIPEPGIGELLVKVSRVSICGSDLNLYSWNVGMNMVDFGEAGSRTGQSLLRDEFLDLRTAHRHNTIHFNSGNL